MIDLNNRLIDIDIDTGISADAGALMQILFNNHAKSKNVLTAILQLSQLKKNNLLKNSEALTTLTYPVGNPFLEYLGAELLKCDAQGSILYLPLAKHLSNSWGKAHGGVLMTLMDMSMSWSARALHPENLGAATIEMKSTFMKAAEGELWAIGSITHKTSTLAFCQAYIYNGFGELCCHSTATFKYSKRLIEVKN